MLPLLTNLTDVNDQNLSVRSMGQSGLYVCEPNKKIKQKWTLIIVVFDYSNLCKLSNPRHTKESSGQTIQHTGDHRCTILFGLLLSEAMMPIPAGNILLTFLAQFFKKKKKANVTDISEHLSTAFMADSYFTAQPAVLLWGVISL